MNVITLAGIQELATLVEQLAADAAVKGVVITSGKETFCAGADLTLLESLGRIFVGLAKESEEQAATRLFEESRKLSLLYRRIETCGKPWVAALNGTALGGGFELALACHHRVAAQNPQTRLGLPETKVGLFPGAGGTTRIARMLAPADALQFLLKGDLIKVDRAKAMKLIDAIVPPGELVKAAKDWIKAGGKAKNPWDVDGFKLPGGPVYSKAGMMTFPPANAIYRRETYDNYPAARAILQVVYEGLQLPFDLALRVELRWFAKILRSPEAGAMMRSLFVSMQELNKGARRPDLPRSTIKRVGIIGAGFMGASVGYVTALAGIDVVLIDRDQESADRGKAHSAKLIGNQISRGRAVPADRDALLARITATADYGALSDCDLVIEAVFEDRKVKAETYAKAQNALAPGVIFGSNTSTLPITSLAREFADPSRFIGIHFFSPVERMMLVEIILGKETGDAALATALDFVRAIKKTPIVVNDFRGFYTSRVVGTYLREGHLMLAEGVPRGNDRECRAHGRHAGRAARAQRRGRGRSRLEDPQGHRSRSRRRRDRPGPEAAAVGTRGKAWPLRPQERQGLLRLSRQGREAAVAGARRPAKGQARPRRHRRAGTQGPPARHPGAGNRALLRGRRPHRHPRSRRGLDPRLRLRAVYRRHLVLYRHDGHGPLRRHVREARSQAWAALCAVAAAVGHGREERNILRPIRPAPAREGSVTDLRVKALRVRSEKGEKPT